MDGKWWRKLLRPLPFHIFKPTSLLTRLVKYRRRVKYVADFVSTNYARMKSIVMNLCHSVNFAKILLHLFLLCMYTIDILTCLMLKRAVSTQYGHVYCTNWQSLWSALWTHFSVLRSFCPSFNVSPKLIRKAACWSV